MATFQLMNTVNHLGNKNRPNLSNDAGKKLINPLLDR